MIAENSYSLTMVWEVDKAAPHFFQMLYMLITRSRKDEGKESVGIQPNCQQQ
jgi:hypothetical protein